MKDNNQPLTDEDKAILKSRECMGHGRGGRHCCCDRVGEYNGYGSGPIIFSCPENCSCHD